MGDYGAPTRVYGVGFGADRERAGRATWIAEAVVENGLSVVDVAPAAEVLDVAPALSATLPALTRFLARRGEVAVGLDFPFGLPQEVVAADDWLDFLRSLPGWADDPGDLARQSETRAALNGGDAAELLRATEEPLGALSPYNRRLCDQTFFGIRDVLRPLVLADAARAVPMQSVAPGRPILLEVYPAGTLERLDAHDLRYQGDGEDAAARRAANLDLLGTAGVTMDDAVRERALEGDGGEALNAVVAAVAAYEHTRSPEDLDTEDPVRLLEGHIYV